MGWLFLFRFWRTELILMKLVWQLSQFHCPITQFMSDSFCDLNTENMPKFSTLRREVILQTMSEKYNEKIGRTEVETLLSSFWLIVTRSSSYYFSCFTKVKMLGTLLLIVYCLNKYRRVPTGFKDEIASHSTVYVKWVSEPVFVKLARLFSNDNRNGNHNFFLCLLQLIQPSQKVEIASV